MKKMLSYIAVLLCAFSAHAQTDFKEDFSSLPKAKYGTNGAVTLSIPSGDWEALKMEMKENNGVRQFTFSNSTSSYLITPVLDDPGQISIDWGSGGSNKLVICYSVNFGAWQQLAEISSGGAGAKSYSAKTGLDGKNNVRFRFVGSSSNTYVTKVTIKSVKTPSRVLTGGWYHFQDAWDALPADLQGVLELIPPENNITIYNPEKTELDGSVPDGCTKGGIDLGKSNGGICWHMKEGVMELKVNLHFSSNRTFKIKWTLADGTTGSFTTDIMKRSTLLEWDLIKQADISEDVANQITTIELVNTSGSGRASVYDMYVRVPDNATTFVDTVKTTTKGERTMKMMKDGRLIIINNDIRYNTLGQPLR